MARQSSHLKQDGGHSSGRPGEVGIGRVPNNPHRSILGERACRPACVAVRGKPEMSLLVMNVEGVYQRDQDVYVEEIRQRTSSRSLLTSSIVTGRASARLGKSGMPFRSDTGFADGGFNPRRASSDTTSPRLLLSRSATARAAANTSSSMVRVVLIRRSAPYCIKHHASYVTGGSHSQQTRPSPRRMHLGQWRRCRCGGRARPCRGRGRSR